MSKPKQDSVNPKDCAKGNVSEKPKEPTPAITKEQGSPAPHDPEKLDDTERRIVAILGNHLGRYNAIRMKKLAEIVGINERTLRTQVNHLKFYHSIPIMSWDDFKDGGYYLSAEASDQATCIEMFMLRIWTSLRNVATLKKISMVEAGEFFNLELEKMISGEDEQKKKFLQGLPKAPEGYTLLTALVRHAQDNPEKYHADLHVIQDVFGAKFIKRKKLAELKNIREQLNSICSEFEN